MLDTNMVSYFLRDIYPAVSRRIAKTPAPQIVISTVTEGELIFGLERRPQATNLRRLVDDFLLRVATLPWDSIAAREYGALRARLEKSGKPLAALDTMIAAHALATGAILVTHDAAFSRVKGLKLEDWTK
jgi:tRNA(fMet)-specific endonuclease VapC